MTRYALFFNTRLENTYSGAARRADKNQLFNSFTFLFTINARGK
jgi:hypothetical protein